jgi:hypothetical protein
VLILAFASDKALNTNQIIERLTSEPRTVDYTYKLESVVRALLPKARNRAVAARRNGAGAFEHPAVEPCLLAKMVSRKGLEPPTCGLGNRRSILLSYRNETPHSRRLPGVHEQPHRWLLRIPPGRLGALQGGTATQPFSSAVDEHVFGYRQKASARPPCEQVHNTLDRSPLLQIAREAPGARLAAAGGHEGPRRSQVTDAKAPIQDPAAANRT